MRVFFYYSLSGSGDKIASLLEKHGVETRKVETVKPFPKSKFMSMMKGDYAASVGKKEKLKEYDKSTEGFDEIIIGSPIWNARISSPVNTVLSDVDLSGKKVKFVLYSASGEAAKAVERIVKEYPEASYVVIKSPKKNEKLEEILSSL